MNWILRVVVLASTFWMSGCPDPVTYHAFGTPYVVKISFTTDGVCPDPFFFYIKSNYDNVNNYQYINYGVRGDNADSGSSWPSPFDSVWMGPDTSITNKKTCSIIYSHIVDDANYEQFVAQMLISNFDKDVIPLTIHFQNLITKEEFHTQGEFPVFDISTIPVCRKVLDGWKSGEKSYIDECVLEIPSTVSPTWTQGPDFDWCSLPEYRQVVLGVCE